MGTKAALLEPFSVVNTHHPAGGDNNLGIVLGKYDPGLGSVQCGGPKIHISGCRDILSRMPVDEQEMMLGPKEDPKANIVLPATTRSCKFSVRSLPYLLTV